MTTRQHERTNQRTQLAFVRLVTRYALKRERKLADELPSEALLAWLTPRKDGTLRTVWQSILRAENTLKRNCEHSIKNPGDAWRDTNNRARKFDKVTSWQSAILADVVAKHGTETVEIFHLTAQGYTSREVASMLGIGKMTVTRRIAEIVGQD